MAAVGERRRRSRQGEHRVPQQERWHGKAVTDEVRSKHITHNSKLITSSPCRAGACSRRICPGFNKRRDQGPALQGRCDNQALRTGQCPVPTNRLCGNGPSRTPVPTEQFRNTFCILHSRPYGAKRGCRSSLFSVCQKTYFLTDCRGH